jgi:hypothetical protein
MSLLCSTEGAKYAAKGKNIEKNKQKNKGQNAFVKKAEYVQSMSKI